jgi:hypothetical protein
MERMHMGDTRQPRQSHLFTVRLWSEEIDEGQAEWRGKLQHIISGEIRYFRDWDGLIALLQTMLSQRESGRPGAATPPDDDH